MELGAKSKVPTLFSYVAHYSELSFPLVELWKCQKEFLHTCYGFMFFGRFVKMTLLHEELGTRPLLTSSVLCSLFLSFKIGQCNSPVTWEYIFSLEF